MSDELEFTVDAIDAVPEPLRPFYKEHDGKHVLSVKGLEDTSALRTALEKERSTAKTLAKKASQLEARFEGIDPDEYKKLAAELAELRTKNSDGSLDAKINSVKEQMNQAHQVELGSANKRIETLQSSLEKYLIDAEATSSIVSEKGVPLLLLPHVKAAARVIEEDGKYVVRILGADGNPRVDAQGEYMTVQQFVAELKTRKEFGGAFLAPAGSGGGTPPNNGNGGGSVESGKKRSEMSVDEKSAFIAKHGLEKFNSLPYQ